MADIFNLTDTWNAGGTTFTAVKMNVTDTASAAASLLADFQVGGASKFSVAKDGNVAIAGSSAYQVFSSMGGTRTVFLFDGGGGSPIFALNQNAVIEWSGSSAAGGGDTVLRRDAAGTLALRNGTNAQTQRTYGSYTDGSNYRRVALGMTTGGVATLTAEGAGTGASGNVLHISSLPTSNPGPGILWNNAGTPAIGT